MSDIESLKKERKTLRASLTKCSNQIHELVDKKGDPSCHLELMKQRFDQLSLKDEEFMTLVSQDEKSEADLLEAEQEKIDEYALLYFNAASAVSNAKEISVKTDCTSEVSNDSVTRSKYKLPVLKLREFSGSLEDWLGFWSQFQKIHDDPEMPDVDKLGYLSMSMTVGSPAKQLVDSYPATNEMYPQVVKALKDRYGREDLLTEYYIRELLKLVIKNTVSEKLPLAFLYDRIQCHMRNLETLGITSDNCAAILMPLVSSSLPADLLQIWERNQTSRSNTSQDSLSNLLLFLKNEVEGSQKMELVKSGFGISNSQQSSSKGKFDRKESRKLSPEVNVPTAAGLINVSKSICFFCRGEHKPQDCKSKMSLEERQKRVKSSHVCFCCLKPGHRAAHCRNRPKCSSCGKSHFVIMCDKSTEPHIQSRETGDSSKHHILASSTVQSSVLLQTLVVNVHGPDGKTKLARLLIDTGSQRSYMLSSCALEMGYKPKSTERIQHALFGGGVTEAAEYNVYKLHISKLDKSYSCDFDVLGQDTICSAVSTIPRGRWMKELNQSKIQLSDLKYPTTVIEILVGADVAGKLYTGELRQLKSGLVAIETRLGWSLTGRLPNEVKQCNKTNATLVTTLLLKEAQVSDLWSLDILGITDPTERLCREEMELAARKHFLDTVKIREDHRFEVDLPWIADHPPLSDNYQLSWKRLESVLRKLEKESLYCEYQRVFDSWEENEIIERVPNTDLDHKGYYMPHHPVVKIGSSTPVRPVFDASAKEGGKYSLNQCLEKGPNLIEKIPSCLARFRRGKIGISGDIEKAFLQISLNEKDRDFLRFLWVDETGQTITYRHCRVVFGVSPSPFLLEACISLLLAEELERCNNYASKYPVHYVKNLAESFYVDNCLTSFDSIDEAKEFTTVASSIMSERMFTLRGWELSYESSTKPTNVLGLLWLKEDDVLCVSTDSLMSMDLSKITKKVILSAAHRIFDPIGIISSFALIPKLLLQETWESKIGWNDEVSEDIQTRFMQWIAEVPLISEVKVPRCVTSLNTESGNVSIHVFSDASKLAYSTAIFLRVEHNSKVTVQLLASRARVAPTSKSARGMTIPRLELLGAVIATRLYKTVIEDFKLHGVQTIFWTDASTVLAWIRRNEPWNVFVMNRIKEIRDLSDGCEWRHVPGEINPADLPSRGSSMKKLLQCRWWEGPQWLREEPEHWPQHVEQPNERDVDAEKKKTIVSAMLLQPVTKFVEWYTYFSQFTKLVRMIGWMQRFISNLRYKKARGCLPPPSDLSANEFSKAEERTMILIQSEAFSSISDPRLCSLCPFIDDKGIMRLETKISNRNDDKNFCCPIVLPNAEHPVVRRLILEVHKSHSHAGAQTMLSLLRRNYWILGGRRTVNSVLNTCMTCKRHKVKRLEVAPTPLPQDRVSDAQVFEVTGVDLAGPLYIKSDNGTKKVWVCLFTCAVYRAVRLELVPNISTHGFLQALRRFTSRQGRPRIIYSDNGTNFVGFDNMCADLDWDSITSYSAVRRIEWRFNPPASPWWGGWWERLIGLVKNLLRRVLGRTSVDYIELQTIMCELESVINARPLTYISDNSMDLSCITPSMFLHDLKETGIPEFDVFSSPDLRSKLKYSQQLKKQLHKRFVLEYLGQLQLFSCKKKKHELKTGDIVLVGDDHSKRINWPLGRILELVPGKDGEVRVVRVRTTHGTMLRPVQRIYLLEADQSYEMSNDECQPVATMELQPDEIPVMNQPEETSDIQSGISEDSQPDMTSASAESRNVTVPIRQYDLNRRGRIIRKPSRFL